MPTQIQWRRGNTAQTAIFTGAVGEITVDTDKKTIVVHDGVTPGGNPLAIESAQQDALAYNHANASFNVANTASAEATAGRAHANAAYIQANTKFASSGGTISGDVLISGNITPTSDNDKYLGSDAYRWHTVFVGPGSVDIDGIVLSNNNGTLTITGATTLSVPGAPDTAKISLHANAAFDAANTAALSTGAYGHANAAYIQANSAYSQANTGTILAQAAYDSANNVGPQVQPAFNAANSAYIHANSAFDLANTAPSYFLGKNGGTMTGGIVMDAPGLDSPVSIELYNYDAKISIDTAQPKIEIIDASSDRNYDASLVITPSTIFSNNVANGYVATINQGGQFYISPSSQSYTQYHTGLVGNINLYAGVNYDSTSSFTANTSNSTPVVLHGYPSSNGEVALLETTIFAQSHGAAGTKEFDGTKIWKLQHAVKTSVSGSNYELISEQTSNTGNSGSWNADAVVSYDINGRAYLDIEVVGENSKQIFWYGKFKRDSLWCTFDPGAGGGGGGK
jgi:hypothetical protein